MKPSQPFSCTYTITSKVFYNVSATTYTGALGAVTCMWAWIAKGTGCLLV